MKILAIDSSGLVASVAIIEDDILVAEYTVNHKKTHSQTLMPMLDEVVKMTELDLKSIDAIAIASGPGSFTGLRIGAASAKGLGLALDKPLVSVPTVDAIAYSLWGVSGYICPMMDARREQVYTGVYSFNDNGEFFVHTSQCAVSIEELAEILNSYGQKVYLLGDGVPTLLEKLTIALKVPYVLAPAGFNRQRAASVGLLAKKYFEEGKTVTASEMAPEYLRKSQAEREREDN